MDWNVAKIFNDMGGPADLHARLQVHYPVTLATVRAWHRRGSIPAPALAWLLHMSGENPNGWLAEPVLRPEDVF